MLLSYTIVDFYFYYDNWAVDMQICTHLTRIQCKVSDTQVTVKACGPLVCISQYNVHVTHTENCNLLSYIYIDITRHILYI